MTVLGLYLQVPIVSQNDGLLRALCQGSFQRGAYLRLRFSANSMKQGTLET
jgi:hypothetical protein